MDQINTRSFAIFLFLSLPAILCSQGWTSDTSQWVELHPKQGWNLDMRYATDNNFVGHLIYDCERCFLRPDAASALAKINSELRAEGLEVKLYDCYRPLSVQWELWEEVPDPNYVADPRKGSMHNRGQAIDVTLVDIGTGKELDMGTDFDFFGQRAYHSYTPNLSNEIQANREKLKSIMMKYGFQPIRTEWWHYSLREKTWPIFEEKWKCE